MRLLESERVQQPSSAKSDEDGTSDAIYESRNPTRLNFARIPIVKHCIHQIDEIFKVRTFEFDVTARGENMNTEVVDSIRKGKDKVIQIYELMPGRCLPEDVPDLLTGLRQAMKQYVIAESKWQDLNASKDKVNQSINQLLNEDITEELIRQEIDKAFEDEASKRQEEFWLHDRNYSSLVDFSQGSDEEAAEEDNGDDIAVTSQAIQTIDPYTKKEYVDPVKNIRCNHSYERSTIMELLKLGRAPRCYHMGCNNKKVLASDLVSDDDLKRHMARLRARTEL